MKENNYYNIIIILIIIQGMVAILFHHCTWSLALSNMLHDYLQKLSRSSNKNWLHPHTI